MRLCISVQTRSSIKPPNISQRNSKHSSWLLSKERNNAQRNCPKDNPTVSITKANFSFGILKMKSIITKNFHWIISEERNATLKPKNTLPSPLRCPRHRKRTDCGQQPNKKKLNKDWKIAKIFIRNECMTLFGIVGDTIHKIYT